MEKSRLTGEERKKEKNYTEGETAAIEKRLQLFRDNDTPRNETKKEEKSI